MAAPILIVEDGSLVLDANTYIDLDYSDAYLGSTGRDTTWLTLTDDQKSICIFRACDWLERLYAGKWKGIVVNTLPESLAFPRMYLYDSEGRLFSSNMIPRILKEAQAEGALLFSTVSDSVMFPSVKPEGQVRRVGVADKTIEKEFFKSNIVFERTRYLIVEDKISSLLINSPNAGYASVPKRRG